MVTQHSGDSIRSFPPVPYAPAPPALHLRDARADEIEAMVTLALAAYDEYAIPMQTLWDSYRQRIITTLGNPRTVAERIVAVYGGMIVGSVLLQPAAGIHAMSVLEPPRADCHEISLLAVLPAARGRGRDRVVAYLRNDGGRSPDV